MTLNIHSSVFNNREPLCNLTRACSFLLIKKKSKLLGNIFNKSLLTKQKQVIQNV